MIMKCTCVCKSREAGGGKLRLNVESHENMKLQGGLWSYRVCLVSVRVRIGVQELVKVAVRGFHPLVDAFNTLLIGYW